MQVDPDDESGIAAALAALLNDESQHERLRHAGLRRAAQFTWQETARQTLAVYRRLLSGSAK
jgi:alpha-1,3-rhamnosyl/mannosyltransferase